MLQSRGAETLENAALVERASPFLEALARSFAPRLKELLRARSERMKAWRSGARPAFQDDTRAIREGRWTVAPMAPDLVHRRVEITGPVDRKMVINALNSGANCFMADFEDATSPRFATILDGQKNLIDAVRRTITFETPEKTYALRPETAVLLVRPRGLHLPEAHVIVDDAPMPAALFDFGLYFFHNARELVSRGTAPYFYLPKLESHHEATFWRDVFRFSETSLGLSLGTVRATCLIETLPAAFEMHEILFALKDYSAGLNCGRWDYIFSFIKNLGEDPAFLLPDRGDVTMDKAFLAAYVSLLVETCHARGIHAMGGMAADIPIRGNEAENARALARVRKDKEREAKAGHDGTWVAHPGLVAVAKAAFDEHMPGPNQIGFARPPSFITGADLLRVHEGKRTLLGLRENVRIGVRYLEAWLSGTGCVPLYGRMEDAATAEIARAQIWQWLRHGADVEGEPLTEARLASVLAEEMRVVASEVGDRFASGRFTEAQHLFFRLVTKRPFIEFLTLPGYEELLTLEAMPCP